jgi:hypothetical protein
MKQINKLAIPIAAFVAGLVIAGSVAAQAATTTGATGTHNPMSNIVNALAQKFNLNVSDVQQVFDDQHMQMEAEHSQMLADRLNQAVKDGKLTQDQADKITAKQKELEGQPKSAIQKRMADLKQWATDNGIPQEFMPFGMFGGHHGGFGHGHQ